MKKFQNGKWNLQNLKMENIPLTPKLTLTPKLNLNNPKKRTAKNCSFFNIKYFKNLFLY